MSKYRIGQRVAKKNPVPGWPDTVHLVRHVDVRMNIAPDGEEPVIFYEGLVGIEIPETGGIVYVPESALRPTQRHIESDVEQLPLFGGSSE